MQKLLFAALVLSCTTAAAQQAPAVRIIDNPIRQAQTIEHLPTPPTVRSSSDIDLSQLDPAQLAAIAEKLQQLKQIADLSTVQTTGLNGIQVIPPCDDCARGEALQVHQVPRAAPTIQTELIEHLPQVRMVPRHIPPPQSHSLLYGFDQSYPELPVVDVDNDCASCPVHKYEIAVVSINGKPTQVLNPEPKCSRLIEILRVIKGDN